MKITTILLIIVIIVLLYIVVRYISSDVNTLSGLTSGTAMTTIAATSLAQSSSGSNSSNFAYSIWFYVNDWNYRYGEPKVIYGRMTTNSTPLTPQTSQSKISPNTSCFASEFGCCPGNITTMNDAAGTNCPTSIPYSNFCPAVVLGAITNNLDITMSVYPGIENISETTENSNTMFHSCVVPNVPIQKWVNLLISVYGRSLDVYLDGKLVKTCVLPGIAKVNNDASVYVTPNGGFSGWTSKFQYYPSSIDPQTAWNIYQKGYGASMLSNIFGKYQVKVSVVENGAESSSVTI